MRTIPAYFLACLTLHYFNFHGRAKRAEYWSYLLCWLIIALPLILFNIFIYIAWEILTFMPGLAVGVRRMHDIGHSGWLLLLTFIPIFGWAILFVMLLLPTKK